MKKIDDIFREGHHQKRLEIRPELWDKLERRLDGNKTPIISLWRPWIVAASTVLIMCMTMLLYLNIDTYEVEDLSVYLKPQFYKEEIINLEEVYWAPQVIFVNPQVNS